MTTLVFDLETLGDTTTVPTDPDGTWVYNGAITAEGVDYLIDLFRKPRNIAELEAYLDQVQELEDAAWALKDGFYLASAIGVQLDMLGALFGEPRLARTDEDYRASIRARWLAQRSNGRPEELISIVLALSPTDTEILLFDAKQANTLNIFRSGDADALGATFYRILQLAHAAGSKLNIALHDEPEDAFRFGSTDAIVFDDDHGFGWETDNSFGGTLGYDAAP